MYQVFISFKNLDRNGTPTRDRHVAEMLYERLTERGMTAFFSPISLSQLGASDYNFAIDSALDRATLLVALGSSREHLESSWVANEWGSFDNEIKSRRKPGGQIFVYWCGDGDPDLPFGLRQKQFFKHSDSDTRGFEELYTFIQNALKRAAALTAPPVAPVVDPIAPPADATDLPKPIAAEPKSVPPPVAESVVEATPPVKPKKPRRKSVAAPPVEEAPVVEAPPMADLVETLLTSAFMDAKNVVSFAPQNVTEVEPTPESIAEPTTPQNGMDAAPPPEVVEKPLTTPPPPFRPSNAALTDVSPKGKKRNKYLWLAVAGGVVVLAAILFPVFSQAREKARQTTCLSNQKQVALGILMYVQDYDERYPPASQWTDVVQAYNKQPLASHDLSILHCPSAGTDNAVPSYAFNAVLNRKSLSDIDAPADFAMIYDSTAATNNANDALTSLPSPGRHISGNNVVFTDGHAKYIGDNSIAGVKASSTKLAGSSK